MRQFVACSPLVEVNGETVYAIVDGMGTFKSKALEILGRHGVNDPKPGAWYKQQSWLDAFKEIAEKVGDNTLFTIGLRIPRNAKFPPQIDSIESGLAAIDVAYKMNHRNGEIGSYKFEAAGPNAARMVCHNPYPCAFDRGIIEAIAKKFAKPGQFVLVDHDAGAPCRKTGAPSCTYRVRW